MATITTLSRESALEAVAALEAIARVQPVDGATTLAELVGQLVDELGLGPNGNLDDDPDWIAVLGRADVIELEWRRDSTS